MPKQHCPSSCVRAILGEGKWVVDLRPSATIKRATDATIRGLIVRYGSVPEAAIAYGIPTRILQREMLRRKIRVKDVLDFDPESGSDV